MTSRTADQPQEAVIPEVLYDPKTRRRYQRGRFLGKGGFAKCFELTDKDNGQVFAGKIVSRTLLTKQHQKDKMAQEISIHRELRHKHIVGFQSCFDDSNFVYIVLELCKRRSLMELHKRRKAITEPEARYYMYQLLLGVKHLHDNRIIHRDLKLGNLFLNEDMDLKIGDFGLATKVEFDGERKRTLCGTPNYIAPEVLNKKGHSFEVDIWSMGCILFTLLVGKPPFETQSLKDTYNKIKKNEYYIPSRVSASARKLITRMLQGDPTARPNVDQVLADEFMTSGYLPTRLPLSCLTMEPRFDTQRNQSMAVAGRRPLLDVNAKDTPPGLHIKPEINLPAIKGDDVPMLPAGNQDFGGVNNGPTSPPPEDLLKDLYRQLSALFEGKPHMKPRILMDEAEDPAAVPMVWISKWVDYSDKYGFGYQLCDDSIGVVFNDLTKLLLLVDGKNIHYIERDGTESYHTLTAYPQELGKKVKLLLYFQSYMHEHLLKTGASIQPREGDELIRLPFLRHWFRTSRAVVMHLNNGTLQVNFFKDHVKIILCPLMGAVTYIDANKNFRTYRLTLLNEHGCTADLHSRLQYAHDKIAFMLNPRQQQATQAIKAAR